MAPFFWRKILHKLFCVKHCKPLLTIFFCLCDLNLGVTKGDNTIIKRSTLHLMSQQAPRQPRPFGGDPQSWHQNIKNKWIFLERPTQPLRFSLSLRTTSKGTSSQTNWIPLSCLAGSRGSHTTAVALGSPIFHSYSVLYRKMKHSYLLSNIKGILNK